MLSYTRHVSQGGDWGAKVSEALAHLAPQGLLGVHMNLLLNLPLEVNRAVALGEPAPQGFSEEEKLAYNQRKDSTRSPILLNRRDVRQTIGYSLGESPGAWQPGYFIMIRTVMSNLRPLQNFAPQFLSMNSINHHFKLNFFGLVFEAALIFNGLFFFFCLLFLSFF